ncbi:MAG TPA: imidazole glycerol phosphate synthase subunit HisH, partial [Steroidobacteraceae bacterium]|nr:imidazole glycerol phosphate synthase subunit HisH [Steroidobacteraceae bacterium]
LTTDPDQVRAATHVILPGVGTAADCMSRLERSKLIETIKSIKQPLLGICVGMQLLFDSSEEGDVKCLGLLPGRVQRFPNRAGLPVPHMGWNQLNVKRQTLLTQGLHPNDYVYFVHSFAAPIGDMTLASTDYGAPFSAAVQKDNIYGVQFHPERSARVGAIILRNFLSIH